MYRSGQVHIVSVEFKPAHRLPGVRVRLTVSNGDTFTHLQGYGRTVEEGIVDAMNYTKDYRVGRLGDLSSLRAGVEVVASRISNQRQVDIGRRLKPNMFPSRILTVRR